MSARDDRERGAALILALIVLTLLGTVMTLTAERSRMLVASSAGERNRLATLYAAEGGVAHARHALARDAAYHGSTLRIGDCDVSSTVAVAADRDGPQRWTVRVEAIGRDRDVHRIEVVLRAAATPTGLPVIDSWREP